MSVRAELIAVGTEMLEIGRRDTNSEWLTERLSRLGIAVRARSVVEDDVATIAQAVRAALQRSGLVLVTGGLGPTEDDRTRGALADALGRPLERDPEKLAALERFFSRRGLPLRKKQADRPRGSAWIPNPVGTAPGIAWEEGEVRLFALPGVPAEMRAMFEGGVEPRLSHIAGPRAASTLKIVGQGEGQVDALLADLYDAPGLTATILSGDAGLELHLRADGADARAALERLTDEARRRLGGDVFGRDDDTLAGVVGRLLEDRGQTLATAESCTAGLIAAAVTEVPGSSAWFRGGLVVYGNELKTELAGVDAAILASEGAVSAPVAEQLAEGARTRCGADFGLGVTGIAGPGGGTAGKPVGLVHLALADAAGVVGWRLSKMGERAQVRRRTVTEALDRLRRHLLAARA
ncbi:MAG: CinA family nicotinamide mononucleotide deamidase-related protein [bacterium]|nr:CinA family nicotinamide mononucleotide deamidase-related protein [bacterium]